MVKICFKDHINYCTRKKELFFINVGTVTTNNINLNIQKRGVVYYIQIIKNV